MIPTSDNPNALHFLTLKHHWEESYRVEKNISSTQEKLDDLYCKIFNPSGPTKVSIYQIYQLTEKLFTNLNELHDIYQDILNNLAQYYGDQVFTNEEIKETNEQR